MAAALSDGANKQARLNDAMGPKAAVTGHSTKARPSCVVLASRFTPWG